MSGPLPPPRPVPATPAAPVSSSSSASHKRRRAIADEDGGSAVPSLREFPHSVKKAVVALDGITCWGCGASPVVQSGLLTFDALDSGENALCPTCHTNFDDPAFPGLIFLPTDLSFFIETEERSFAARQHLLVHTGQRQPRICPNAEMYRQHQIERGIVPADAPSGLYQRYTLRNFFPTKPGVVAEALDGWIPGRGPGGPRYWHGAPMAAINKAFSVLGQPVWRRLPEEKQLLRRLQDLYEREPEVAPDAAVASRFQMGSGGGTIADQGSTGNTGVISSSATTGSQAPSGSSQAPQPQQPPHQTLPFHHSLQRPSSSASDSGIHIPSTSRQVKRKHTETSRHLAAKDTESYHHHDKRTCRNIDDDNILEPSNYQTDCRIPGPTLAPSEPEQPTRQNDQETPPVPVKETCRHYDDDNVAMARSASYRHEGEGSREEIEEKNKTVAGYGGNEALRAYSQRDYWRWGPASTTDMKARLWRETMGKTEGD